MHKPTQLPSYLFPQSRADRETYWRPAVDVYRVRDGWLLKFDLAGVRPEDVKVEVSGCRVTVSGVRRDLLIDESAQHYSMEIAYNRFERTIELPCDFASADVVMENRDGILFVRLITEEER